MNTTNRINDELTVAQIVRWYRLAHVDGPGYVAKARAEVAAWVAERNPDSAIRTGAQELAALAAEDPVTDTSASYYAWLNFLCDFAADNLIAAETIAHIFEEPIEDWAVASDGIVADGRY